MVSIRNTLFVDLETYSSCAGHDTTVTVAGTWTRKFLEPLLTNKNFMNNTLVMEPETEATSLAHRGRTDLAAQAPPCIESVLMLAIERNVF